ncbi:MULTISPECIES: universal stress protein [Limosilactobacillus]|jgi:nucleotide-binding universal stress UspA family protein|uniref:universal stress protein n=1 Tax=Limosilactobacillus TaxID=2742598 RepID=UPI0022652E9F|nr:MULTISPECIES: universal stress protein [Limosilactobacillus]MCH3921460.1 universal stress protein [Limosilactobacillus sp.]MCH3928231.1 universal stress protein [Limosilactobacillus sp.]
MANDFQYHNIMVAVDGSQATSQVLDAAIDSALRNNAHLDILNVTQVDQITDGYSNAVLSEKQTFDAVHTTRERLDDLKAKAEKAGLSDVSIHIRFGNPKRVIAREFPKDHHNDLIVMGTTGLSGVERFVLGSVTNYVNRNALCDVMVVQVKKQK